MTTIHNDYGMLLSATDDAASFRLSYACNMLNRQFGDGYAAEHPGLVAQLIMTMTIDYARATFAKVVGEFVDAYREGTDKLTLQ